MPKTEHGHLDATKDPEAVATLFSEYPDSEVGIYTGKSEIVALDVDVRGKVDGFGSLGFLPIPKTYSYATKSQSGKHFIYDLSDSNALPPRNGYRGYPGIDRKSGSSYIVHWSDSVPASRDEFAAPPDWLLDLPDERTNSFSGFSGGIDSWLETLSQGEPTERVQKFIDDIPEDNFNHDDVVRLTYFLVRLGAEGQVGVGEAFAALEQKWVRPPYDTPELRSELSTAILGAIKKAGEEGAELKNLEPYEDALESASSRLLDFVLSEPVVKAGYFKAIRIGLEDSVPVDKLVSIVWSAPATKTIARGWGISYLLEAVEKAQGEVQVTNGAEIIELDDDETEALDITVSMLKDKEREAIKEDYTFVDRYVWHAGRLVPKQNAPYDRINAWTILSCGLSEMGFIPRRNGPEPLNMYMMILGDTTTGKSYARKTMMNFLREIFMGDPEFNIGGNPSPSALQDKLINRDGKVSFFNKDEAHGALKQWMNQDFQLGLVEDLAELYDGHVPPMLRKGTKENSGKSATTYFIMWLMGTPKAMIGALNRDMFLTGFLARFQWAIGDPRIVTRDSMAEEDADGSDIKLGFDSVARQVAGEFCIAKRFARGESHEEKVAIKIDRAAAKRLQEVKWLLSTTFEKNPNWDILEPSLVRIGVTIRKAASLLAISDGRDTVALRDVLLSIEAAEEWVTNLVQIASQISASDFQRATDELEEYIISKGGEVKREVFMRRFRAIPGKDMVGYLDSLFQQGRLREFNGTNQAKMLATTRGGM